MWNASLIDGPIPIEGVEGYHLNIAPEIFTEAMASYRVEPANPRRIFAGGETVFLRFADEAEAQGVLSEYFIP